MIKHKTLPKRYLFWTISILLVFLLTNVVDSPADEFVPDDFDISDSWQGTAVSVRFSDNDASQDFDGNIPTYTGNETFGMANTVWASGSVAASVLGSGTGTVQSSATLLYHGEGANLGSDTQSLKPFTISGTGTISSTIKLDFDGLLVVKEGSASSSNTTQARVDFAAEIQQFDSDANAREVVGSNRFEGAARLGCESLDTYRSEAAPEAKRGCNPNYRN